MRLSLRLALTVGAGVAFVACAPPPHAHRVDALGPSARDGVPASSARSPAIERAVLDAYLRSREVDVRAYARLDPVDLPTVFADSALAARRREIDDRRASGRPMAIHMTYHPHVTVLGPALAVVDDDVENHSVRLDPVTGAPVEADPHNLLQDTYTLERREGRWFVVLTARVGS